MAERPRTTIPRVTALVSDCPIETTLAVIGGRWKGAILQHIAVTGESRPAALRRRLPEVSEAVLLRQLGELVEDGILERRGGKTYPLRVTYALTDYGATLGPVLEAMCAWGSARQARGRER